MFKNSGSDLETDSGYFFPNRLGTYYGFFCYLIPNEFGNIFIPSTCQKDTIVTVASEFVIQYITFEKKIIYNNSVDFQFTKQFEYSM
jgi:hypothetical protein